MIVMEDANADAGKVLAGRLGSLADALGRTLRVAHPPRLSIGIASLKGPAGANVEVGLDGVVCLFGIINDAFKIL